MAGGPSYAMHPRGKAASRCGGGPEVGLESTPMSASGGTVEFEALTPDRWADFERLFGDNGACGGCWCMWFRLSNREFEADKGEANRRAMKALVETGEEPGILAYVDGEPAAWCALAPREGYGRLARSRILKPVDEAAGLVGGLFLCRSSLSRARADGRSAGGGRRARAPAGRHDCSRAIRWSRARSGRRRCSCTTGWRRRSAGPGFTEVARRSETRPIMRREIEYAAMVGGQNERPGPPAQPGLAGLGRSLGQVAGRPAPVPAGGRAVAAALPLLPHPSFIFESDSFWRFRGRPDAPNYERAPQLAGVQRPRAVGRQTGRRLSDPGPGRLLRLWGGALSRQLRDAARRVAGVLRSIGRGDQPRHPEDESRASSAPAGDLRPESRSRRRVLQFVYMGNDFSDLPVMRRRLHPTPSISPASCSTSCRDYEGACLPQARRVPGRGADLLGAGVRGRWCAGTRSSSTRAGRSSRGGSIACVSALRRTAEMLSGARAGAGGGPACRPRSRWTRSSPAGWTVAPPLDLERPNRALREALDEDGVPYLDLLPAFVEAARLDRLYKPNDSHWNLAGNRLAADEIYRLARRGRGRARSACRRRRLSGAQASSSVSASSASSHSAIRRSSCSFSRPCSRCSLRTSDLAARSK